MINGYDRWDATGEVPAILVRNSASEQGHRMPDPRWHKLTNVLAVASLGGITVAAVTWLMILVVG